MSYTCDFSDNIAYGAEAINGIRSTFASKGVIPDNNDSCLVSTDGQNVKIKKGQALFEDGCRIEVCSNSEEYTSIALIPSKVNYVFLQRNKVLNSPKIAVSDVPATADDIQLAEIALNGVVTDKRLFSKLKIPSKVNHKQEMVVSIVKSVQAQPDNWIFMDSFEIDYFGYQSITISKKNSSGKYIYYGTQNLIDNSAIGFHQPNYGNDSDYYPWISDCMRILDDGLIKFELVGNKINCYFKSIYRTSYYNFNETFTVKLL